jgi:hypothetical protein
MGTMQMAPAGPSNFSNSHVSGSMQSLTGTNDPYVYTGIYRFTPIISASSQFNGDAPTTAAVGIQNLTSRWYYTFEAPAPTPTPTSSTTATPTPTPSSSEVIEPTPTPTPSSSEPSNGGRFFTNTGETKGAESSGNCLATEFSIFADNDVFASVANAEVGDRFYSDLGLLNPWQGANKWYTVTDNSGAGVPLIDRKEFKIDNNGKILEIHQCVAPEPTPSPTPSTSEIAVTPTPTSSSTNTPTPTPSTSAQITGSRYFSARTETKGESDAQCYEPTWPIFGNNAEFTFIAGVSNGDHFYSDLACTSPWDGQNKWYTLGDTQNAAYGDRKDFKISSQGVVLEYLACEEAPTPTPSSTNTPTPTPSTSSSVINKYYVNKIGGEGDALPNQECEDTPFSIYTSDGSNPSNVAQLQIGDMFYTDGTLQTEFAGASLIYDISSVQFGAGERKFHYKEGDGITAFYECPTPDPTSTPTPTPSSSEVAESDPNTLYFFHGGNGGHTYTPDLTANEAVYYITGEGLNTTDLGVAMEALVTNSPTPYSPENATGVWPIVGEMDFSANETITNSTKQWDYFATGNGNYGGREAYYLAVPNNASFPEDLVANSLVANLGNNQPVQMASSKDFTWNGDAYTLYKLPLANSNAAQTYKFLGTA